MTEAMKKLGEILFRVPENFAIASLKQDPQALCSILLMLADEIPELEQQFRDEFKKSFPRTIPQVASFTDWLSAKLRQTEEKGE